MPIRHAKKDDIPIIARVMAASFGPDIMFRVLFPHQDQFPEDFVTMWRRKMYESWWDYGSVLMVSYQLGSDDGASTKRIEQSKSAGTVGVEADEQEPLLLLRSLQSSKRETITGVALWKREGEGANKVWGTWGRYDPRHLIKWVITIRNKIAYWLRPCRASVRPTPEDPDPVTITNYMARSAPFAEPLLNDPEKPWRANHWELVFCGVHPSYQGKGYGRKLAEYGVGRAKEEGVSALVISAPRKEGFYEKAGFTDLVGYMTADLPGVAGWPNPNPLRVRGVDGGACMWYDP